MSKKMKGIIQPTEMVKAIAEGRKTMMRVVVKPQDKSWSSMRQDSDGYWNGLFSEKVMEQTKHKSPYRVGQVLYVKEAWGSITKDQLAGFHGDPLRMPGPQPRYVPMDLASIFLRVLSVRVERLQDISEEDAKKEGVDFNAGLSFNPWMNYERSIYQLGSAQESYMSLWWSIHKKQHTWGENPFVWVIEFERISKEDAYRWEADMGKTETPWRGYQVSTDYAHLWRLVQEGYNVPCFYWRTAANRDRKEWVLIGSQEIVRSWMPESEQEFTEAFKEVNLHFIPPSL